MTSGNDAGQWHETAQHLVQAHRALPGALTSYAPTLEQLHFAHADTHEALARDGAAAPDDHTHTGPTGRRRRIQARPPETARCAARSCTTCQWRLQRRCLRPLARHDPGRRGRRTRQTPPSHRGARPGGPHPSA